MYEFIMICYFSAQNSSKMFQPKTYQARRQALQSAVGQGLILLPSNEESPINCAGNVYPFRQDSSFLYYFGLNKPQLAGLIDIDEQRSFLFGDDAGIEEVVWTGPQPSLAEQAAAAGLTETKAYEELGPTLQAALSAGRPVHFLPPYRGDRQLQLSRWLGQPVEQLQASEALIKAVVAQRAIKTAEEIAEIEKALTITRQMHIQTAQAARPGMRESELAGLIEGVALAMEAQLAYAAILTVEGQTLHKHAHSNLLQEGQLVLCDFGAAAPHSHYASDITRTFPVSPSFTTQQRDIYQIVLDAQLQAIAAMQPEQSFREVHLIAARVIAEGLKGLGLMKGDTEAAVEAGAHALFFPHGLGHAIGLDVHDMEDLGEQYVGYGEEAERSPQFGLKYLRMARRMKPGFVLTVEPGIYFIPQLIQHWQQEGRHADFIAYDKLEAYAGFGGIRIEDNILLTDEGHRVLGPSIPKSVAEVEALRQG